ncbi:Disabled-like protein 2-interacting protein [Acropora cervicornis]|uniref:Disabled-like protein 2-interacting protein n=1 Tax=Acropora cervicornis TaxID=6130 RepID=A0AAD9QD79_ACRCE|nr:Disabled-like protein 2-interacting protein [Acropora cervicornis]
MVVEKLEGWLTILTDDGTEWLNRLCVLFSSEKKLRTFIDDIEYLDCTRFLAATTKIKSKLCDSAELIENPTHEGLSRVHRLRHSRRFHSEDLLALQHGNRSSKLSDISKKIADGLRSHRSKSLFVPRTLNNDDGGFTTLSPPPVTRWRSQETLDSKMKTTTDSVDLSISGHVTVRPIHPSILSRQHCFQVTTPHETKYFSCRSSNELEKWVVSIKKSIQPTRDIQYRTDIGLTVWIVEAKGLTDKPKRRFFCELYFDKAIYAKTSSKTKSDLLFWGENFAFNDLPEIKTITVQIFKEVDGKKEKRKPVASVDVPVDSLEIGVEVEKWFPVTMESNKTNGGESPSIRLRFKYQKVSILPVKCYNELLEYLKRNYMAVCQALEPVVSVKLKDEISRVLLRILQAHGKATEFLATIVLEEVKNLANLQTFRLISLTEDENLVFRGNSFATKAMDSYMKMIGESYLQETLGDFVQSVYEFEDDCEVDPSKKTTGNIEANKENLKTFVDKVWTLIMCSSCFFPSDLRATFHEFRRLREGVSEDLSTKLIRCWFNLFAISVPSNFIAKPISSRSRFGGKEEYMGFMNGFVEKEFVNMRRFIDDISLQSRSDTCENQYEGIIDCGRELALLFSILKDVTGKMNQSLQETYLDSERNFVIGNESLVAHRKWASSSDLVTDQDKNNITLTPVSQIRIMKSPKRAQHPSDDSLSEANLSSNSRSPTAKKAEQSGVSRYDKSILSPISDVDPPNSSLRKTDLQSSLRRRSYRRAIDESGSGSIDSGKDSVERGSITKKTVDSPRRTRNEGSLRVSSVDGGTPSGTRGIYRGDTGSKRTSRTLPVTRRRDNKEEINTPLDTKSLVITDQSRTSSLERQCTPKPHPLATSDCLRRSTGEKEAYSLPSSPRSSRRSSRQSNNSAKFLTPDHVARTPSQISSSSSASDESWHSVASSLDGGGRRRVRKIPRTIWERMAPKAEPEDFVNGYDCGPSKTTSEYEKELTDLREELLETKRTLASTHEQLILQESSTHKLVASFKERLAESENSLQKLREEKEQQAKELLDRLVSVESELRKEQDEMQEVIQAKQVIIEAHERRIKSIDSTNAKLIATLNQITGSRNNNNNNKVLNYPSSDL